VNEAKEVILIPHWVHETLRRHQLPITDVLNFSSLRPKISVNDLVGFLYLNRSAQRLGFDKNQGFDNRLTSAWMNQCPAEHADFLWNTVYPLMDMKQFQLEVEDRLFTPESRSAQYEVPFNIYDLSSGFVGVVINPGFFTGEDGTLQHQFTLLRELVKALYVSAPFHEVATTDVFLRYLGLLSKKRIMV
jgi:hypothetical protein